MAVCKKKKSQLLILGLILMSAVLALFSNCGQKAAGEVKIGVLMPLTGDAATLGEPAWNAIQLAFEQWNGKKSTDESLVRAIPEDTKAEPSAGVSAFHKLITVDKVKIVIGPLTSTVTLAVAPIAEQNKIVIISPGASAPKISDAGEYVFRNELSDSDGGKIQAEIAIQKLHYKKVACVYINTDYGSGLLDVFRQRFVELGGEIVLAESFDPGETDFRSVISKIKRLSPDAVFLIAIDETIPFVRQKSELGLRASIYTTPIFENIMYLQKLGDLAEGIIYVYYGEYNERSDNEIVQQFVESYHSKFGINPTYYSALAYDAANIVIQALNMANFNPKTVRENLYKIKNFQGVTGLTSFDTNGDVSKPVSLKTVRSGKFTLY
jgi:branched-chain amino acid transport system substrate-binding protein